MILSDKQILEELDQGSILIQPFDRQCLGSNSYDVHLGSTMARYTDKELDAKKDNPVEYFEIPDSGILLNPSELYLGITQEYTETWKHVPFLEGKSSAGRLGIDIHATAGKGDVGFCNHWTLEISCKMSVRIYKGMPIGQLIYFRVQGDVMNPYHANPKSKYNTKNVRPMSSQMWKNTF